MAKKSSIEKNERRKLLAKKFEPIRRELRRKVVNEKIISRRKRAG